VNVAYRDGTLDDATAIATFARSAWLNTFGHLPYPPEDLRAYLETAYSAEIQRAELSNAETRYRLARRADAIVGYCMMGALHLPVDDEQGVELRRLYVDESVKGAGVADALMQDCVAWARERGAHAIYLSVWENNARAQRFYRRHGFTHYSEWKFMIGQTADRDLIWKRAL
jgi:ribosomal protein S18 acetylase RimI-like enzyme